MSLLTFGSLGLVADVDVILPRKLRFRMLMEDSPLNSFGKFCSSYGHSFFQFIKVRCSETLRHCRFYFKVVTDAKWAFIKLAFGSSMMFMVVALVS